LNHNPSVTARGAKSYLDMPPPSIPPLYSLLLEVLADAVTLLSAPIERVLAHLSWMLPLGAGIA